MSSALFEAVQLLERYHVHFTIERTRPDSIRLNATLIGQRLEIEVFEDNHIEISRFSGSEDVEEGLSLLKQILADDEST